MNLTRQKYLPVTLSLTVLILVTGVVQGTWYDSLSGEIRALFGYSPQHITDGAWQRIVSSFPLTGDPGHLGAALAMTMFCVGWLELQRGWEVALAVFFASHILSAMFEGVILSQVLFWSGIPQIPWHLALHEVGPSAGYYGCLGTCIFLLPKTVRGWSVLVIFGWLTVRLLIGMSYSTLEGTHIRSDLAHLVAFGFGIAIANLFIPRGDP